MKRAAVLLVIAALLISLCACSKEAPEETSSAEGAGSAQTADVSASEEGESEKNILEEDATDENASDETASTASSDGPADQKTVPLADGASSAGEDETGILYTAAVSALQAGYCVLTMKDALQITVDDSFGTDLTWTTSNEEIASVEDGLVLPIGSGRAEILVSDGQVSAAAVVLVDTAPTEVVSAGSLLIESNGQLYECGLAASAFEAIDEDPQYVILDGEAVYVADGIYYVNPDLLYNILCCCLGQRTVVRSANDQSAKGEACQLCGDADIRQGTLPPITGSFGESEEVITVLESFAFPDGHYLGRELFTQILKDGQSAGLICYHSVEQEGIIYQDAAYFISCYGLNCSMRYDQDQQALIISLLEE